MHLKKVFLPKRAVGCIKQETQMHPSSINLTLKNFFDPTKTPQNNYLPLLKKILVTTLIIAITI